MTTELHPIGTIVRVKRGVKDGDFGPGTLVEIELLVNEEQSDLEEDGVKIPFYWADRVDDDYGNGWVRHDDVEFVQSRADREAAVMARKPPTLREMQNYLVSTANDERYGLAFTETEREGEDSVLLYGTTKEGLRIAVSVKITAIEEVFV